MRAAVKMPLLDQKFLQPHLVKIADTEYVNPENDQEKVKLSICVPNVCFNDQKLEVS